MQIEESCVVVSCELTVVGTVRNTGTPICCAISGILVYISMEKH